MSTDTKWIIGTGVAIITAIVGTGAVLAGLLLTSIAGVNSRIDDLDASLNGRIDDLDGSLNGRIDDLRSELQNFRAEVNTRMAGFDTRLRNVERVRLFCVGGPEGSRRGCERHGKSYLTRRRRGEEGDGGGSLTGGAIPSA